MGGSCTARSTRDPRSSPAGGRRGAGWRVRHPASDGDRPVRGRSAILGDTAPPSSARRPLHRGRGRAAVALVEERVRQGLPPKSVVSVTGLPLNYAIRQAPADGVLDRQPMFDRIAPDGVEWADGRHVDADVILWATGFVPPSII